MKEDKMKNMDERKEMRSEMKEKRKEMKTEYMERKFEMRLKYRKLINQKFSEKINKFSTEKLQKIIVIIEKRIKKIENDSNMSDYKKMKMLAIYEALKDVIEDKLF
jgi:uncharacterized protein YPO0396